MLTNYLVCLGLEFETVGIVLYFDSSVMSLRAWGDWEE